MPWLTVTAILVLLSACTTLSEPEPPLRPHPIVSGFGDRLMPDGKTLRAAVGLPAQHSGVDILAPVGTLVVSASVGRVEQISGNRYCGEQVSVEDSRDGLPWRRLIYAHIGSITVEPGEAVVAGQPLGAIAPCDSPAGNRPHLHLSVITVEEPVDPASLFIEADGTIVCAQDLYDRPAPIDPPSLIYPVRCDGPPPAEIVP